MQIARSGNIVVGKNLHNKITNKNLYNQLFIKTLISTFIYHQHINDKHGAFYIYS
jgi:hypothetical protein